jgi:hypothetical protein
VVQHAGVDEQAWPFDLNVGLAEAQFELGWIADSPLQANEGLAGL